MADLATKSRRRGHAALRIHAPLIELTKAEIIRRGHRARRRLRPDRQLLRPRRAGRRLRPCDACQLRLKRLRRRRRRDPTPYATHGAPLMSATPSRRSSTRCRARARNTGRPAVFCRFAGCNLWTGREKRPASAVCQFCDTDFVGTDGAGGGHFGDAGALAARSRRVAGRRRDGEPVRRVHRRRAAAAARRRARRRAPRARASRSPSRPTARCRCPTGIDWVCVSPKAAARPSS